MCLHILYFSHLPVESNQTFDGSSSLLSMACTFDLIETSFLFMLFYLEGNILPPHTSTPYSETIITNALELYDFICYL